MDLNPREHPVWCLRMQLQDNSSRWLLPPQLCFMLPLCLQPQVLGSVITMHVYSACFPNYQLEPFHRPAVKQTLGWILFLSLFILRNTITHYTYVILVFYGLEMRHFKGGVSCALRHTVSRKPLPMCVCTPPAPHPHPCAYITTSTVMGVLAIDYISTATTSYDS